MDERGVILCSIYFSYFEILDLNYLIIPNSVHQIDLQTENVVIGKLCCDLQKTELHTFQIEVSHLIVEKKRFIDWKVRVRVMRRIKTK